MSKWNIYRTPDENASDWIQMSRNWGQNWQSEPQFTRQFLSFQVTTSASDEKMLQFENVAPHNWRFHQNFQAEFNF